MGHLFNNAPDDPYEPAIRRVLLVVSAMTAVWESRAAPGDKPKRPISTNGKTVVVLTIALRSGHPWVPGSDRCPAHVLLVWLPNLGTSVKCITSACSPGPAARTLITSR